MRRDTLDMYNPGIYEWRTGFSVSPEQISHQQQEALRMQQIQPSDEQPFQQFQQQQQLETEERKPIRPPRRESTRQKQQQQQQQFQQQHQQQSQHYQQQQQHEQQQSRDVPPKAPPMRQKSRDEQNTASQEQVSYFGTRCLIFVTGHSIIMLLSFYNDVVIIRKH